MTYNAHLLLHLVDSVREWGPLWAYSLYPFESMNGQLGKFVCGNRHAQVQILDRFTTLQALPTLWWQVAHNNGNACIAFSFKDLIRGYNLKKHCVQVGSVFLFGKGVKMGTATHYRKMKVGSFHFLLQASTSLGDATRIFLPMVFLAEFRTYRFHVTTTT